MASTLKHYEVISPEMVDYGYWAEPPEPPFRGWALVEARNKKDAIRLSVKEPYMQEWVERARQDGINPFAGLKAELAICEHGVCWGCEPEGQEEPSCPECRKAWNEPHEALSSAEGVEV